MEFVKDFKKLNKNDVALAGGKGASLGEMTQAGILVPAGFVIFSTAFERFLEETDLNVEIDSTLHSVNHKEMHTVENASEKIQALVLGAEIPKDIENEIKKYFKNLDVKYVAVRSSATAEDSASAAWAGQLDSFLNTTEKNLLENVKKCWASLFTPRAIFYRFEKDLHKQKISVAVVVQKMVQSEVSGIAFSVHPVTQDRNQLIIEAGFGLGEAIVSGQITPDSYVVEKNSTDGESNRTTRRIIDKNVETQKRGLFRLNSGGPLSRKATVRQANEWREIPQEEGEKQALTDKQILELSEIILHIEKHYGFPCDIEWAYEGDKFYIVQSRPITTLTNQKIETPKDFNDYSLHFRQSDMPFIFTDIVFRKDNYGEFDYVVLQKGDHITGYLSVTGMQEAYSFGESLLDKKFSENIIKKLEKFLSEIKEHKVEKQLLKKDDYEQWKFFETICDNIGKLYRYCEHPVLVSLEEKVISVCKNQDDVLKVLGNKKYAKKLGFTTEQLSQLELLIELGELKFNIHSQFDHIFRRFYELLERLAKKHQLSLEQVLSCKSDEIDNLFAGKIPEKAVLNQRINGLVFLPQQNKLLLGEEYEVWKNKLEPKRTKEIKGTVAYRGKTKGIVKIHLSLSGGEELPQGSILVTGMTNPQIVPYLKNAVAIVTDEGGLTCHAAIISRELKIPCIVGTKIATQVLKDGDLVEVDANNGIIKILEKFSSEVDRDKKKITLSKTYSREHSLFYCYVWNDSDHIGIPKWGGIKIKNNLFIGENGTNKLSVWYDINDINYFIKNVTSRVQADKKYFKEVVKEFWRCWNMLIPYINKKRKIDSVQELKRFYNIFVKWWSPMAVIVYVPDIEELPKKIRNEALKIREDTQTYSDSGDSLFLDFFSKYFPDYEEIKYVINPKEIFSLKDKKLSPSKLKEVRERLNGYFVLDGNLYLSSQLEDVLKMKNLALEKTKEKVTEFKGYSAYKGKVRGNVKLILYKKEILSVSEGEIIVTEMTSPDFLPAMKKAAAFITDEGGTTCHAAIISRELKKPCIVGTKIATQVLKDGDLVEVDADNGVVKIIK